jgi:cytochrome c-type biogenesis protein CcmH
MILFWSLVTLMVVAAVAAVVPALLGRVRVPGTDHTATNIAVFRDRLAELRADRDQGNLTEAQFEEARAELEAEFAHEVPAGDDGDGPVRDPRRGRWALAVVAVATPLLALAVYLGLGRPGLVAQPPASRMAEQQFRQFAQMPAAERIPALKRYLDQRPRTGEAWFLLAQSYSQRSQFGDAVEAFAKARQFIGDDTRMSAQLLAGYAQALALSNDRQITERVLDLANRSLEQDPDNQIALWLVASGAMQAGDGQRASQHFRRLARQFPAGSESATMLKDYIAQAEGVSVDQVTIDRPEPEASGPELTVRVSLSGNLAPQAEPDDTVFIFARSPEGPPMPVAAVRKTVADLPVEVTLSDAQAMTPQRKLSQQEQVVVGARVSKSGRPMAASGDLQGLSDPIAVADGKHVSVTIDSTVE